MVNLKDEKISYARVWNLAWPIILANVTIPLIGATNIAVMGRLPSAKYIGAVALGVVVLQCIYWSFAFLRKGTTGVTAQAFGAGDLSGVYAALVRSLLIALALGVVVIGLQRIIGYIAFEILDGSAEVEELAREYFDIRIWGSIATMGNYVMLGWFYGIQKPRLALALRIAMNALNIPLAIYLALDLNMGVAGAAWSAFISHNFVFVLSLIAAFVLLAKNLRKESGGYDMSFLKQVKDKAKMVNVFQINFDIFVRTLLVFFAFSWFTSSGAKAGDEILAANTVLINLFWFISYALDGFSNAAETLVGQAIGANNKVMFRHSVSYSTQMAGVFALIFSLTYFLFGEYFISLLTKLESIASIAATYLPWLIFIPIIGIWCFQLDGIFIGATQTKVMRNMMIVSFFLYALCILTLPNIIGNHGLWLSICIFLIIRAVTLFLSYPQLVKDKFRT